MCKLILRYPRVVAQRSSGAANRVELAAAILCRDTEFDPGLYALVNAIDHSPCCFHMTPMPLSRRGLPALVEPGSTLASERFARAWRPRLPPSMSGLSVPFRDHEG